MVSDSPRNMIPSRLLLCFRANAAMDPSSSSPTSNHAAPAPSTPPPAYFSSDGAAFPRILRVFSCRRAKVVESTDARGGGGGRRKGATRRLPRIVKAVLFEAPLVKKIRDIKSGKKSRRSNSTLSDRVERILNAMNEKPAPAVSSQLIGVDQTVNDPKLCFPLTRFPSTSSTLSHSSAASQSKPNHCVQSNIIGQEDSMRPVGVKRYRDSCFVPCLLLMITLAVICWGKICAIVCALMWLIAVPLCTRKLPATRRRCDFVGDIRGC